MRRQKAARARGTKSTELLADRPPTVAQTAREEIERRMRSYAAVALALAAGVAPADVAARVLQPLQEDVCGIALWILAGKHQPPRLYSYAGLPYEPNSGAMVKLQEHARNTPRAGATSGVRLHVFEPGKSPRWLGAASACAVIPFMLDCTPAEVLFALRTPVLSPAFEAQLYLVAQRIGDSLAARAQGVAAAAADLDPEEKIKVLLIDDEPLLTSHVGRLLRQRGFEFESAERGQHGLELAAENRPDAILVDRLLPDMDGIEVLRALRRDNSLSTVPVIMLSGQADEEVRVRALRAGADDFVAKPFSARELVARIGSHVRMTQARRAAVLRETELLRLRQSQQELRTLLDSIQSVRVDERRRLAREVHDQLGQLLTAAKIELQLIAERAVLPPGGLEPALGSIDQAIASVQNISILLRPPALEQGGLVPALRWLTSEWQRRSGLTCQLIHETAGYVEPTPFIAGELLRICQEALTNAMRHAKASAVMVHVRVRGLHLVVRICDNGTGITREAIRSTNAIGLVGMRERAASIRASLQIYGSRRRGTLVTVRRRLPLM